MSRRLLALLALLAAGSAPAGTDRLGDPLPLGAVTRYGTSRLRSDDLRAVVWLPDGKRAVTAGEAGSLRVWDATTGAELRRIDIPPASLPERPVPPAPDDESPVASPNASRSVVALGCSPDGKVLASCCLLERFTRLWDIETGEELAWLASPDWSAAVVFSPDGALAATAIPNVGVHVYDLATRKEVVVIPTGRGVPSIFFADAKTVATYGTDMTLRRFDARTGKETDVIAMKDAGGTVHLGEASADLLVCGVLFREDPDLHIWDCKTGNKIHDIHAPDGPPVSMAVSPDHKWLALLTGNPEQTLYVWDTKTGKLAWERKGLFVADQTGEYPLAASLLFSPDSATLACATASMQFFEAGTGKERWPQEVHHGPVASLAVSPDGKSLLTGGVDHTARLWDTETGRHLRLLEGHDGQIKAVAWSPDGKVVATGSHDQSVRLWNPTTGELLHELPVKDAVETLSFTLDGSLLAVGGSEHLSLWEPTTGKRARRMGGFTGTIYGVAFAPDGKSLASAGTDRHVRVWNVADGKEMHHAEAFGGAATSIAFSADGQTLFVGGNGDDGGVTIWSAESGAMLRRVQRPEPTRMAATPDSRLLVMSGVKGRDASIFEVASGSDRRVLRGEQNGTWSVALSPDAKWVFVGGYDGTALRWPVAEPSQPAKLTPEQAESAWRTLSHPDADVADAALRRLLGDPEAAVTLLAGNLKPVAGVPRRWIEERIRLLDDDNFETRDRAFEELARTGRQAELSLWLALTASPSEELTRRAERLLERMTGAGPSAGTLRDVRAVELLERIGTVAARRVLEAVSNGAADGLLTQEASAALDRLTGRPK